MSNPELPNPFMDAKRASGVKVQLQPDDVVAGCHDLSLHGAIRILNEHGSIIATRMLEAGIEAAVKIADGGEA